ncbi:MAG: terminase small subunit [Rhodospirillaceae bacterium]|jgi:hypothetical protein|nr:terminase small subunit [Rhodospirillaceae bacterium]MBT6117995.1 terminase small subunit [Rhodospirillaceae bacterium]
MSELELPGRQEKFCRHYMLTGDGTRSAVIAGYSPRSAPSQASRMLRNDKIRRRLAELRGDFRRDFNYDRDLAMARLEALYRHALRKERYATAIRATELQARLAGLLAEPGASRRAAAFGRDDGRAGRAGTGACRAPLAALARPD